MVLPKSAAAERAPSLLISGTVCNLHHLPWHPSKSCFLQVPDDASVRTIAELPLANGETLTVRCRAGAESAAPSPSAGPAASGAAAASGGAPAVSGAPAAHPGHSSLSQATSKQPGHVSVGAGASTSALEPPSQPAASGSAVASHRSASGNAAVATDEPAVDSSLRGESLWAAQQACCNLFWVALCLHRIAVASCHPCLTTPALQQVPVCMQHAWQLLSLIAARSMQQSTLHCSTLCRSEHHHNGGGLLLYRMATMRL